MNAAPDLGTALVAADLVAMPGGRPVEDAAREAVNRRHVPPDAELTMAMAIAYVQRTAHCTKALARVALQVASAQPDGIVSRVVANRAVEYALHASQTAVTKLSTNDQRLKPTAAGVTSATVGRLHRMEQAAGSNDYCALDTAGKEYLYPLDCNSHKRDACRLANACASPCCSSHGLSANFVTKKPELFYRAHLYLYKKAIEPLMVHHLMADLDLAPQDARARFRTQYMPSATLNIDAVADFLGIKGGFRLPACSIRDTIPPGMRGYVGPETTKERLHCLLQPAVRGDGKLMSCLALGEVAMALGPGWLSCPFFLRAMAEPRCLAEFQLPPPSSAVATHMARALELLLENTLVSITPSGAIATQGAAFDAALYAVMLHEASEDVIDVTVPPTHCNISPQLARLLLAALEEGHVDTSVPSGNHILYGIANALDLEVEEVARRHPFAEQPALDDKTRSTIIYGNVAPHATIYGQDTLVTAATLADILEAHAESIEGGTTRLQSPLNEMDKRIAELRDGYIVVQTVRRDESPVMKEQRLPLAPTILTRLARGRSTSIAVDVEEALASAEVCMPLAELGKQLKSLSRAQLKAFIHAASAPLTADEISALLDSLTPAAVADMSLKHAGTVFSTQGDATIVSTAASVVAVIRCDEENTGTFRQVGMVLQDDFELADFVTAYMSCRLRLDLADNNVALDYYELPLATRALHVQSLAAAVDDDDLARTCPGSIQAPMPHHDAFFTVFHLNRNDDIGRAMGVMLALQAQEAIAITRNAMGIRRSFIIWFVDHVKPFDLASALQRQFAPGASSLTAAEAESWAMSAVSYGGRHLKASGMVARTAPGKARPQGLSARNNETKLMLLVSWGKPLHDCAVPTLGSVLRRSGASDSAQITADFKLSGLLGPEPRCQSLRRFEMDES